MKKIHSIGIDKELSDKIKSYPFLNLSKVVNQLLTKYLNDWKVELESIRELYERMEQAQK